MRIIWFFLCLIGLNAASGQTDTVELRDLSVTWIPVEADGSLEVLATRETREIVFDLTDEADRAAFLVIESQQLIDVWINEHLISDQILKTTYWSMDSLRGVWGDSLRVTVYGAKGLADLKTRLVGIVPETVSAAMPLERMTDPFMNAYVFIVTLLMLLMALYRRLFPQAFSMSYRSPLTFTTRTSGSDQGYPNFASADNLFAVLFLASMTSLLLVYLRVTPFGMEPGYTMLSIIRFWISLMLMIVVIIGVKFMIGQIVTAVFELKDLANILIQDFIHFTILSVSLFLLVSMVDITSYDFQPITFISVIRYGLAILVLIYQVLIFLKVDKLLGYKKLMIFIYLCTTEFLFGFLIIYWLIR